MQPCGIASVKRQMDMMTTCNQNECRALRKEGDGLHQSFVALKAQVSHSVSQLVTFDQYAENCSVIAEETMVAQHNMKDLVSRFHALLRRHEEVVQQVKGVDA